MSKSKSLHITIKTLFLEIKDQKARFLAMTLLLNRFYIMHLTFWILYSPNCKINIELKLCVMFHYVFRKYFYIEICVTNKTPFSVTFLHSVDILEIVHLSLFTIIITLLPLDSNSTNTYVLRDLVQIILKGTIKV